VPHIAVGLEIVVKRSEFQQLNGKDGKPAYIAYKGNLYDVSKGEHWKNGSHMNSHGAGDDLTHALSEAPHGEEVLDRIKLVGILEDDIEYSHRNNKKEKFRDLYRLLHPHPVFIHWRWTQIFGQPDNGNKL
jgi:predicted heme/steroid binding protein